MNTLTQTLDTFRRGPALLEEALRGSTDNETVWVPAPGKWTIRQLVRHVADTEIVVGMRLRQIIAEDKPTLIPFDQELWAANLGYENAGLDESFRVFRTLRDDTAAALSALPEAAFERIGLHPERGAKTLLEWVAIFGNHVQTHAKQIREIRSAFLHQ